MGPRLGARDVCRCRTLLAFRNFKRKRIADLEVIECYALKILRVEEEVFGLTLAGDKAKAAVRKRLYCSLHLVCVVVRLENPDLVSSTPSVP